MDNFFEELCNALSQKLPGEKAQQKLSPEGRNRFTEKKEITPAAVLILIYPETNNDWHIVLMKRSTYNGHHSGQVSFPGGKEESSDSSLEQTALRETKEEIGVITSDVKIAGKLTNLHIPISNFMVHPFVGITFTKPRFKPDPAEADYIITFPLNQLIKIPVLKTQMKFVQTVFDVPYFEIKKEMVWGATAMILNEFIEVSRPILK